MVVKVRLYADHLIPYPRRAGQIPFYSWGVKVPRRTMDYGAHLINSGSKKAGL